MEKYKAELQIWVNDCKHPYDQRIEQFRAVSQSGQSAVKSLFLMNGGAAAAILAFIGHLSTNHPEKVAQMSGSLRIFVIGLALSGGAAGFTFFSNWMYAYSEKMIWGHCLNAIAVALGVLALGAFGYGIDATYTVFAAFK
jgi:hypothetical protein